MNDGESFNLVEDPWIRVRFSSGKTGELSLLELFNRARDIRALANDLPTQDFAILRVLLAILQRSVVSDLQGDEDPAQVWSELWEEGIPLRSVENYLSKWRHRFYLDDAEAPFMQVAGMHTSKHEVSPISKIIADVPDGYPFFAMRSASGVKILTSAETARWLVHVHAFDTAGIKSGVVGDPSVKGGKSYSTGFPGWAGCLGGLYIEEESLEKTLLLNLVLWDSWANSDELLALDDTPTWEQVPKMPGSDNREPLGFADSYTWQSRRVLLHGGEAGFWGVVLSNGDKLDPYNMQGVEPMTAWRRSPNKEKSLGIAPVFLPLVHSNERLFWRSLSSVLPSVSNGKGDHLSPGIVDWIGHLQKARVYPRSRQIRMHAVGLEYGTQNSVITEMIDDSLVVDSFLLGDEGREANVLVRNVLKRTDDSVFAFGLFARNLRMAAGDDDRADGASRQARAAAYFELSGLFESWIVGLSPQSDLREADNAWNKMTKRTLLALAADFVHQISPRAIAGHKGKAGWMTAAKAESLFNYKLNELLPCSRDAEEGSNVTEVSC